MSAGKRLRGALGVTLVAHVFVLALSLAPAVPLSMLLHRAVADTAAGDAALFEPGAAALLEVLHDTAAGLGVVVLVWMAVAALIVLVGPWLTMSWLAALAKPRPVSEALGAGARSYFPSLAVSIFHGPLLAVAVGLVVAGPVVAGLVLSGSPDAQTHDLWVLGALVPGVVLVAWVAVSHDLGRAALVVHEVGPWRATRLGMRAALRPTALPAYVMWLVVGLALAAVGLAVGAAGDLGVWWATLATLVLQQAVAFARTVVRARWLAGAVARVERLAVARPPVAATIIGGGALVRQPEEVFVLSEPPPRPHAETDRPGPGR